MDPHTGLKTPKPWWNSACKRAVQNKKKAYRKLQRAPSIENRIEFNKANAISVKTIRQSKQDHWNKFLESINSYTSAKEVWSKIQAIKGKKQKQTNIRTKNRRKYNSRPKKGHSQRNRQTNEKHNRWEKQQRGFQKISDRQRQKQAERRSVKRGITAGGLVCV